MDDADDGAHGDSRARLDALAWGRFHTLTIAALGITWILDGLEVTLAGSVAGALQASPALRLTDEQVGLSASLYIAGAVVGALLFGWLADRLGRKRLFNVTIGLYLVATGATAFAQDFWSFALLRLLTGAGIGGEYAAINSAIQELIPRALSRTDGSDRERQLLDRRGRGRRRRGGAARTRQAAHGHGVARGVRHRRGARSGDPVATSVHSRESALAHDARTSGGRRAHGGADREPRAAGPDGTRARAADAAAPARGPRARSRARCGASIRAARSMC